MEVANCTFSLIFQPIPRIRRSAFEIEDNLQGYIKPFQIASIPDEAPLELPRITANSENGHSRLSIAARSAQILSDFDEQFSHDPSKCLAYSREKAVALFQSLSKMSAFNVDFAGLSAQLVFPVDELGKSAAEFINDTYLGVRSDFTLSDVASKFVYEVDEACYLNLEVKKVVQSDPLTIQISPDSLTVQAGKSSHAEYVGVVIDFNNRLAFNQGNPAGCDLDTIDSLYQRVEHFIGHGIDSFIHEGVVSF